MDCVREVRDGAPLRVIAVRSDDFATEVDAAASLIESAVVADVARVDRLLHQLGRDRTSNGLD
ncbi:MAG: hypothetical protein CMQ24_00590 [Gammaproteobacteria bacterium]|nr:hypothetical protein [Gammaproteobacteria bacterium]